VAAGLLDCVIVGSIGALTGIGELVSRYRDAPVRPLNQRAGQAYVMFNAAAAILALIIIRIFGWTFQAEGSGPIRLTQLLVAGFGSIAFFRTSLFVTRAGGQDVGIGPSALLSNILGTADRSVDREQGRHRSKAVVRIMEGVHFSKAHAALPAYCLALMQNVSAEEKLGLAEDVASLQRMSGMSDRQKSLALGLRLLNLVGEDLLDASVDALKSELKD
jgi:hypothetical protein